MPVLELSLHNVRSHELDTYAFDKSVTIILGPNGSGKTTILEAIYILLRGTSFRGRDRDVISYDQARSVMKLATDDGERRAQLLMVGDKPQKQFKVEDKASLRLPAKFKAPVVLFEPDELRLLSSSPQRRRQFIDGVLERLSPAYATALSRYGRVLLQRNELLKQREHMDQSAWENHLFAWDVKFSELAETIVTQRRDFIATSNERLSALYSDMAAAEHDVRVAYSDTTPATGYSQAVLKQLHANRIGDSHRGYTSVGPHRDDFVISLDGHAAVDTASRGEMRTIMLAYKLLEVRLQEEAYGTPPLILMDDVFSELDIVRERHLMESLKHYQTIITATDLRDELKIDASIITL